MQKQQFKTAITLTALHAGNSAKTSEEMFVIMDSNRRFQPNGHKRAVAAKLERASKFKKTHGAQRKMGANNSSHVSSNCCCCDVIMAARLKDHFQPLGGVFCENLNAS